MENDVSFQKKNFLNFCLVKYSSGPRHGKCSECKTVIMFAFAELIDHLQMPNAIR